MAKPVIKFKTYRQSDRVGGKIYGVPNLADPVVASVTMQEVIDYAKLHNYSASTLEAMLSQVISGVADLVARDGKPRYLSDLLKFEPVIKGTFDNLEQTVTNQKVLVRPRMLKEIKVTLDPSQYSWQNQNDVESPRLISVAPLSDDYSEVTLESLRAALGSGATAAFGWTYAGNRLCPNGWDNNCSFSVILKPKTPVADPLTPSRLIDAFHLDFNPEAGGYGSGPFAHLSTDDASDNIVVFSPYVPAGDPIESKFWYFDVDGAPVAYVGSSYTPVAGDVLIFVFTRTTANGDTFTVEKAYTL